MKVTKKILRDLKIFNSYNVCESTGNTIFVDYYPAENGLGAHYAYWKYIRFDNGKQRAKEFTVTHREEKYPVLEQVKEFINKQFGINITDKDPFGGYHPEGTLNKLIGIIKAKGDIDR